jgi:hypothetical protein
VHHFDAVAGVNFPFRKKNNTHVISGEAIRAHSKIDETDSVVMQH